MKKIAIFLGVPIFAMTAAVTYIWFAHLAAPGPVEEVSFSAADGAFLTGDLYLPSGEGPHPAMVALLGSGPEVANDITYRAHAIAFARRGIAVLMYDKRGAGRSEGDYDSLTMQQVRDDGIAALEYVRTRSDIDGDRIGLMGYSEGAWFTPEIAVRDGNIAFIVNPVMPATSRGETIIYESSNELRAEAISEDEIAQAAELRRRIWDYYRDAGMANDPLDDRRAALEAEVDGVRSSSWHSHWSMGVGDYDPATYRQWMWEIDYDPAPWLVQLDAPIMVPLAENDENIPTDRTIEILNQMAEEVGLQVEILVLPNRTHSMFRPEAVLNLGYPADYLPTISSWAAAQVEE